MQEEERMHQLPNGYTGALTQLDAPPRTVQKKRQSLLGNSWHYGVTSFWVQALVLPLLGRADPCHCVDAEAPSKQLLASAPLDLTTT